MQEIRVSRFELTSVHIFLAAFVTACAVAAVVIGSFPFQASIATVFLFAGAHNFMEFRYFAARMPLHWGRSRVFYMVGIGGVIVLAAAYLTLYFASGNWMWSLDSWATLTASWNTVFVLWLGVLFYLRGRQRPKSDWRGPFRRLFSLLLLPGSCRNIGACRLFTFTHSSRCGFSNGRYAFTDRPNLSEETNLFWRITQHAGSQILPGISSHLLVTTHVFLESIHYAVWILLIPLVDWRAVPWKLSEIPLFSNAKGFPKLIAAAIVASLLIVVALWGGFAIDYTTTRDVYFAFAIAHVMAEFPFLIKML